MTKQIETCSHTKILDSTENGQTAASYSSTAEPHKHSPQRNKPDSGVHVTQAYLYKVQEQPSNLELEIRQEVPFGRECGGG